LYCAIASSLFAQTTLTEADALAKLSSESPRVRAIRSGIEIAKAEALAAARWPNPRVTYDRESVAGITEDMTTVAQPLPVTGRRGLEIRAGHAAVEATTQRINDEMRRARADLRLAFADLAWAQSREQDIIRARDRLQQLAGILQKRQAAGDAAGFDRLRALREVSELDADRVVAAADRTRAQAVLASFFAPPVDPLSIVVVTSSVVSTIPSVDVLYSRALEARGESLALARDIEASGLLERAAARRAVPEPELVVGSKTSTGGSAGSVVAINVPIPLFDRGQPERALARARAAQAQARSEAFQVALRSQIASLRAIATERRAEAERYRTSASAGADELARIAQISYDAGERGIFELLDAYRGAMTARVRQSTLDAAARQVEVELEFVSGWEIP
jgi:cobalt-zinc-cadmium efflux system outer membrane protein